MIHYQHPPAPARARPQTESVRFQWVRCTIAPSSAPKPIEELTHGAPSVAIHGPGLPWWLLGLLLPPALACDMVTLLLTVVEWAGAVVWVEGAKEERRCVTGFTLPFKTMRTAWRRAMWAEPRVRQGGCVLHCIRYVHFTPI